MSVLTMVEAVNSLETIFETYMGAGGSLATVEKIYKGGVSPQLIEFPCIIIRASTEDREYMRASKRKVIATDRIFHLLIGCFEYTGDIWESFVNASNLADEVAIIIEEDDGIAALGYDVFYDGAIEYATLEFGGDQEFCYGVNIPILIKVKGRQA